MRKNKILLLPAIFLYFSCLTISCAKNQEIEMGGPVEEQDIVSIEDAEPKVDQQQQDSPSETLEQQQSNKPCVCVKNFDPVCHQPSGQTFGNRCEALCDPHHKEEQLISGQCQKKKSIKKRKIKLKAN